MTKFAQRVVFLGAFVGALTTAGANAGQPAEPKPEAAAAPKPADPNSLVNAPADPAKATDPNAPVKLSPDDAMAKAIQQYQSIAQAGGWPVIPDGKPLKEGDVDERVAVIRTRLVKSGDLEASLDNGDHHFDQPLADAVAHFQARHGEEGDGIVGAETLAAMNIPADQRLEQLQLNVQRRVELPSLEAGRSIIVNIPDFTLIAAKDRKPALTMKVVVGDEYGHTPTFDDEIETIVFNPYWNVPRDITKEELIPKLEKNPNYLAVNHMEVVQGDGDKAKVVNAGSIHWSAVGDKIPFRIRQMPGRDNPLGRVKFLFPNQYEVYLHDTPHRAAFNNNERNDSHGCIRVEKPEELAVFLLSDEPNWNAEAVAAAMQSDEQKTVTLTHKVPVHILYRTAWVRDGQVNFREDFYNKDGVEPEHANDAAESSAPESKETTKGSKGRDR